MSNGTTQSLRQLVAERAYHVCEYCLIHGDDTFWGCQVDHIISRKHGGATESANLAWSCACCNAHKGTDLATLVGEPPQLVRLFHPRKDRWNDSFQLNGARIDSSSVVGGATEKLLRFNDESRIRERRELIQVGRYPTVEAMARMKE